MTAVEGAPAVSPTTVPVVELRGIGRTFPGSSPVTAIAGIDLVVPPGDHIAIVGPSGSGKSTLLHILGLLDRPTAGRYLLDGFDTSELSDGERTALRGERIGFVFQSFHLLGHRSATENVELALLYGSRSRRRRRERAMDALDRVGLGHRRHALPVTMSGGERQRVAIARALVGGPSLLLADEPTGNLDSATSASVLGLFDSLHRDGMTIVMITHDTEVAREARRTVTIHDGRLTEGV